MKYLKMALVNICIYIAFHLLYEVNTWFYNLEDIHSTIVFYLSYVLAYIFSMIFNINYLKGGKK